MKKTLWGTVLIALPVMMAVFFVLKLPSPKPLPEKNKIFPYTVQINSADGSNLLFYGDSRADNITTIGSDLGQIIYSEDRQQSFPPLNYQLGSVITVNRAPEIIINDWGKDKLYRSFATTVNEFLSEKGIEIGQDDKLNVAPIAPLYHQMKIKITRVAVTDVLENTPIDFKVVNKDDPNLDEGKSRIGQAGKKGVLTTTYRVTRENGIEISRVLVKKEVAQEPVTQIVYLGTKPAITVACRYNSTVIAAAIKYGYSANKICNLMMYESMGRADAVNPNGHYGLFQYATGAFESDSKSAGFSGASIFDPTAQIYAATWALTHGKAWRW